MFSMFSLFPPVDDEDYLTPWEWLLREYTLTPQELLAGELRGAGLENGANVGFDPMLMPFGKATLEIHFKKENG